MVAGPFKIKSPRIENSVLESLRASLKKEIPSEIKDLLLESQRELLKLPKPKTGESRDRENELVSERGPRNFYTQTKIVRLNNPQNCQSRKNIIFQPFQAIEFCGYWSPSFHCFGIGLLTLCVGLLIG